MILATTGVGSKLTLCMYASLAGNQAFTASVHDIGLIGNTGAVVVVVVEVVVDETTVVVVAGTQSFAGGSTLTNPTSASGSAAKRETRFVDDRTERTARTPNTSKKSPTTIAPELLPVTGSSQLLIPSTSYHPRIREDWREQRRP